MEPTSSAVASQQQQQQQLTLFQRGQQLDNTLAHVHSPSWRRTWKVPQQLISMTAASIAG
jgi:hypothetical protein